MLKFLTVFIALLSGTAVAQQPPVEFTAEQDHQHMMDLLGIKALRRGPSGNDSAPNHANYDEALANPYPDLPDVLTLKNGDRKSTRLNSSHSQISYAVFCLKKKKNRNKSTRYHI